MMYTNIVEFAHLEEEELLSEIAKRTVEIDRIHKIRKDYLLEELNKNKEELKNLLIQLKLRR